MDNNYDGSTVDTQQVSSYQENPSPYISMRRRGHGIKVTGTVRWY